MPSAAARCRTGRDEHRGASPASTPIRWSTGRWSRRPSEYIAAGDIFQVVLSQRVDVADAGAPVHDLPGAADDQSRARTCSISTSAITTIVGASPEMLVRVEDGVVTNHPIAGTRPRGADAEAGRRAGRGAAGRPEGAGRAHHAGRSRPQRRRPRLEARARCECRG